jgi:hypothetical protein
MNFRPPFFTLPLLLSLPVATPAAFDAKDADLKAMPTAPEGFEVKLFGWLLALLGICFRARRTGAGQNGDRSASTWRIGRAPVCRFGPKR